MAFTLYKEIRYAADGIPGSNLSGFPKLISITGDEDIAAECALGGGIKFTSADGLTDLPFGLYPSTNLASGNVVARVKLSLLAAASVGDVIARIYYDGGEVSPEDKAGTVDNGYLIFMPLEESPGGAAPQFLNWVTETNEGTVVGTISQTTVKVGNGIEVGDTSSYVSIPFAATPANVTVEAISRCGSSNETFGDWIAVYTTAGQRCDQPQIAWFLATDGDANFGFSVYNFDLIFGGLHAYLGVAADGTIQHLAGTYDGSNIRSYQDGALANTTAYAGGLIYTNAFGTAQELRVGKSTFVGGRDHDEVRVSSVARSGDWLAYSYQDDFANADTFTLGPEEGAGDTFTATAALTIGAATCSGSGEFDPPVYTGTAALTIGAATCAGSGEFDAPVYTGSAALTIGAATCAGSGLFAAEIYSGTAALTAPAASCSASGEFDPPTYTGSAALTAPAATASGSGEHDPPTYSGTLAAVVGAAVCAASATFSAGTKTGTAALVAPAATCSASGQGPPPPSTPTQLAGRVRVEPRFAGRVFVQPRFSGRVRVN
jgi:hypothetical protein